jgi:hypothetical protein
MFTPKALVRLGYQHEGKEVDDDEDLVVDVRGGSRSSTTSNNGGSGSAVTFGPESSKEFIAGEVVDDYVVLRSIERLV